MEVLRKPGFAITTWGIAEPSAFIFSFTHLHIVSVQHTLTLCEGDSK